MCITYIYNLCFKNDNYDDISEFKDEISVLDKCVILLKGKDPYLVLKYTSDCIIFSKSFIPWYNSVKPDLKSFLDLFKQIEIDPSINQLVFFYKIPIHYHERFLNLLKME